MAQRIEDKLILQFLAISLIFLFTSFSQTLGTLYLLILIVDFIFQQTDKNVRIRFESSTAGRAMDLMIAIGAFVGFIFVVQFINSFTGGAATSTQSALQLLSESVPVFEGNQFFQLITFGLFVAIIESIFFFGRLMEAVADNFVPGIIGKKVDIFDIMSTGAQLTFLIIAAIFTLVHVQTRAGADVPLLITFIFGYMSCLLVATSRNLRSAVLVHIINNTIAMAVVLKLIGL